MPEWYKIRAEVEAGAGSVRELAQHFGVVPETIYAAFRRMPDGKEQRAKMQENVTHRLTEPTLHEVALPAGAAQRLRQLEPYYDDTPVPAELATLAAELLQSGVGMRPLALATNRPLHVVQGWAAQGGYLSEAILARHQDIRTAIELGAETIEDVADLVGLSRERVRQITYSMPDMEEVCDKIGITRHRLPPRPDPIPVQETITPDEPEPVKRVITKKERDKLLHLIDRARNVQRNATPAARRAYTVRDEYVRKLLADYLTISDLAEAAGVKPDSIRDWSSIAKTYRRQLITEAIARKQRAKRRA